MLDSGGGPSSPPRWDAGNGACDHARCDAVAEAAVAWRLAHGPTVLRSTAASVVDEDGALRIWLIATTQTLLGRGNDEASGARNPTALGLIDELLLGPIQQAMLTAAVTASGDDEAVDTTTTTTGAHDDRGGGGLSDLRESCCEMAVCAILSALGPCCWASEETRAAAALLALCAMRAAVVFPCADPHDPGTAYADPVAVRRVRSFGDALRGRNGMKADPEHTAAALRHYRKHFAPLAAAVCAASSTGTGSSSSTGGGGGGDNAAVRNNLARARLRISAARTGGAIQPEQQQQRRSSADGDCAGSVDDGGGIRHLHHQQHAFPLSSSDDRIIGLDAAGVHAVYRLAGGVASDSAVARQRVERCRISERPVVVLAAPRSERATYGSGLRERRRFCHMAAPVSDVPPHSYAIERIVLSRLAAAASSTDIGTATPTTTPAASDDVNAAALHHLRHPRRDCQKQSRALPSPSNLRPSMARPSSAGVDRARRVECTAASLASEAVVPADGLREILERRPSGADLLAPPERVVVAQRSATRPASAGHTRASRPPRQKPSPIPTSISKRFCPARCDAATTAAQHSSFRPFVSQSVPRVMQLRAAASRLRRWRPSASIPLEP